MKLTHLHIHQYIHAIYQYMPAGATFTPISQLTKYFPRLPYQVYLDEKMDEAITEMNNDVRRTLRAIYKTLENPPPASFLTSKDSLLDAYGQEEVLALIQYIKLSTQEIVEDLPHRIYDTRGRGLPRRAV